MNNLKGDRRMDGTNIIDVLETRALKEPGEIAYTFLSYRGGTRHDRDISYQEAYDNAGKIAAALQNKGIRRGDRVLIFSTQTYDNVYAVYGSLLARAVFILVPPPIDERTVERFTSSLKLAGKYLSRKSTD